MTHIMRKPTPRRSASARRRLLAVLLTTIFAGGCATQSPPRGPALQAAPQWYATLPHGGSITSLSAWWQQQGDPLLAGLIEEAQQVSPTLASARSAIEQARAARTAAAATLLPGLDATGSVSRSRSAPFAGAPTLASNQAQAALQTAWEVDVLGGNRAARNAADERLQGAQAQWHDARVLVAAETARQYYALRACEKLVQVTAADAASRSETARLSAQATQAGFEAPATAALARASASASRATATHQQALCDIDVKALVALSGVEEPLLRQRLAQGAADARGTGSGNAGMAIDARQQGIHGIPALPADVLAQRPDVFNAARALAAASDDVGSADAARFPRLSLSGAITTGRVSASGSSQGFDTWSIGPLALTVPLFDGGTRRANLAAAQARYQDAASRYRAIARQAVREVEEALVDLQSTADRTGDSLRAAEGYAAFFNGTEARYKAGLASLVELEDARRTLLAAQSAVVRLELERSYAWVALYRALGGGWTPGMPEVQAFAPDVPPRAAASRLP
ncbi:MAG: transporter [Polaromonas sp.]|nr:transporter [Polaromonas sp.]